MFAVLTVSTGLSWSLWLAIGNSRLAALLAARRLRRHRSKVLYHSRWIVPDSLVMLACAMTLAAALRAACDD